MQETIIRTIEKSKETLRFIIVDSKEKLLIEPKYKVGDTIYYIGYRFTVSFVPLVFTGKIARVYIGKNTLTYYIKGKYEPYASRKEDKVFKTYEQCMNYIKTHLQNMT